MYSGMSLFLSVSSITGHRKELKAFLTSKVTKMQSSFCLQLPCAASVTNSVTTSTADSVDMPFQKLNWFGAKPVRRESRWESSLWRISLSSNLPGVSRRQIGRKLEGTSTGLPGPLCKRTSLAFYQLEGNVSSVTHLLSIIILCL